MINRYAVMAVVLLTITSALWAQDRQFQRNPWRGLKGGLKAANAPELTSEQEEQLRALLTEFRETTIHRHAPLMQVRAHRAITENDPALEAFAEGRLCAHVPVVKVARDRLRAHHADGRRVSDRGCPMAL